MCRLIKIVAVTSALSLLLVGCVSVRKYNAHIVTPIEPEELRADVDYIKSKLEKLHPELYWYISKEKLDGKFDSLKAAIDTPITSNDFFFKLSPVLSSVRQGHMRAFPILPRLTRPERKSLKKMDEPPLAKFNFEVFDSTLYVVSAPPKDTCVTKGAEVVSVNGIAPQQILAKFSSTFTSDGYNTTFYPRIQGRQFPYYFHVQANQRDSIHLVLRQNDSLLTCLLKRQPKGSAASKERSIAKQSKLEVKKAKQEAQRKAKQERKRRKLQGYNPQTKTYSKSLRFVEADSSVAVLKINDFSRGDMKKFYARSFARIDSLKPKALVIDLRDNPGGRLRDIGILYSYLVDSTFTFTDRIETTTRTSYVLGGYSGKSPVVSKVLGLTFGLPFIVVQLASMSKDDGRYYFRISESKPKKPKPNAFKGKVYVLINGGSFSASSILSSNLKATQRATFVGTETGGAFNGCVAGRMPVFVLPHSKLPVRFGLGVVRPFHKTTVEGRGIMPDIEIAPTINDRIEGTDPELEWVLGDVKSTEL